jgi:ABC-type Fe3+-siderophore transport system permease subunit
MDLLIKHRRLLIMVNVVFLMSRAVYANGGCRGGFLDLWPCIGPYVLFVIPMFALPLAVVSWIVIYLLNVKTGAFRSATPYILAYIGSYTILIAEISYFFYYKSEDVYTLSASKFYLVYIFHQVIITILIGWYFISKKTKIT